MESLAVRNQNPGNMKNPGTGSFNQYSSPEEGFAALLNDIEAKKSGNTRTGLGPDSNLVQFAETWAPASDNNNPAQYAANLANTIGVSPDARIADIDTAALAEAITLAEDRDFARQHGVTPGGYQTQPPPSVQPTGVSQGQDAGVLETLAGRLSKRGQDAGEAVTGAFTGDMGLPRALLRTGGAAAGAVGDLTTAGLSAVTPDFIEKPFTKAVGSAVGGLMSTKPGQALMRGYENLSPDAQKDLQAGGNIASLVPLAKGAGLASKGAKNAVPAATRVLAKTGGLAGDAARKSLVKEALEIVSPKETAKRAKEAIKSGRGLVGSMFGKSGISPDPRTLRAAEAAAGIVRRTRSGIENANAIKGEIGNVATKLKNELDALEVAPLLQAEELDGLIGKALKEIGENPVMVGNAEVSANRIFNKFKRFLPDGDVTASNLLDARKKLDSWMDGLQAGNVFDPAYETAKTTALRAIRQGANDLVQLKAPSIPVKQMLQKQSALFDALENVAAKAVKEVGETKVGQFAARHPKMTGLLKGAGMAIGAGTVGGSVMNLFSKD